MSPNSHESSRALTVSSHGQNGLAPAELRKRQLLSTPHASEGGGWTFALKVLRRWGALAVGSGVVLAGLLTFLVYYFFEPQYQAEAYFKIEERTPFLAFTPTDDTRSKLFFQTQIELIRSPMVLGDAVQREEVARVHEIAQTDEPILWLARHIGVTTVGESELFRIIFAARNPDDASTVVNAITESYFKLRDQSDSERTEHVIELLEKEKNNRSREVVRLRQDLSELAKQVTGRVTIIDKGDASQQSKSGLIELQNKLVDAQVERAVVEARLQAFERELQDTGNDAKAHTAEEATTKRALSPMEQALREAMIERAVATRPELAKAAEAISDKQTRLMEIESRMRTGRDDPMYRQLSDELAQSKEGLEKLRETLRPEIEKEADAMLRARRTENVAIRAAKQEDNFAQLRTELETRKVTEERLRIEYEMKLKEAKQYSGDGLELEFKRDSLARAEKVYDLIAARSLQLQTERLAPARVTLMRLAEPPHAPIEKTPWKQMGLASLLGLLLPFGLAFSWEKWIHRISDSSDVRANSGLTLVGEIAQLPQCSPKHRDALPDAIKQRLRIFEASVDTLQTTLTLSKDLQNARILALTSAVSGEGKTTVAAQLAMSLARVTKDPVLLIDGDMRSPSVHRVFDIPLEPGLASVLSYEATLEESINTTWSERVHFLPAGRLAANPLTLLADGAWERLLKKVPSQYRYIVVDTPPALAASDAIVLAKGADAPLICAMRDRSRLDQVRLVAQRLMAVGATPAGVVLSGVPTRTYLHRYGSYDYIS